MTICDSKIRLLDESIQGANQMAPRVPFLFVPCSIGTLAFVAYVVYLSSSSLYVVPESQLKLQCGPVEGFPKRLRVYISDLEREMNYGLLEDYWSKQDSRNADHEDEPRNRYAKMEYPPYPSNPLIKQYSAEYWLLADLLSPSNGLAQRVGRPEDADVIFVPFFATLSAEMQLDRGKAKFRHKTQQNADYLRQRKVLDLIKSSPAWKASHGRDHVFVLTDPVAMWHVREEISSALLLVVDFGGWYMEDSKASSDDATGMIQHTQVSLLKDVIIPYTHLLPTLNISEDHPRETLLYFKGARHRHRGGLVRDKLWSLLDKEPHFVIEEGFPNSMGREQSIQGMRNAGFCLHPAGDTPTSCRLFDAIASLCIPVIISDNIELPFEGMIDYTKFSVFVSVHDALQPKWLVNHLKAISATQRRKMRENMAQVQHIFEYENNYPGGIGPAVRDGAVSHIWKKILFKVPSIKEMIVREWRKPNGSHIPVRCHCT